MAARRDVRKTQAERLPRGRPVAALVLAALLPVVIFVVFLAVFISRQERAETEQFAADRAREIMNRVETEISSDIRAMLALAQATRDTPIVEGAQGRSSTSEALFPQWLGAAFWTLETRTPVYSTFDSRELEPAPQEWVDLVGETDDPVVGGIEKVYGEHAALIHLQVPQDERGLVLTLGLRPQVFQNIMMSELPEGAIGAIVDRKGNFLARSLDYERRIGTPATEFVRGAVAKGGAGLYRGRTYEGFENLTAYYTSPLTGWSTHIAISDALVDRPSSLATLIGLAGGITCLVLAGGLFFLVAQDNSRRTQSELALRNMQRMESIASLTGGVAHDFNNLLTVIIGNLQKLSRSRTEMSSAEVKAAIEGALSSSRRAANLTRSLLAFSRQQALEPHVIDVNAFVGDAADLVGRTIGEGYKVSADTDPAAGRVRVDESQLGSALLNLAVNARDAMPGGGSITFRSERAVLDRTAATALELSPGAYAKISVADNGPGMPAEVAEKAFDPFFTTKDVGKGTGLGLSQVEGFIRQSGGAVELVNRPGEGVTINLYLPTTDATLTVTAASGAAAAERSVKPLRVLVVEDEPIILAFATEMLEHLGHKVVACANADEALAHLQAAEFDLLFSDVVLPGGTSGADLARTSQKRWPMMKALLATGYARDQLNADQDGLTVMTKPYDRDQVVEKLAELFGEAPATKIAGKVLIVEDEPLIRMMAVDALEDADIEVAEAATGAEALDQLAADPAGFAAAIVDLGLPDVAGDELVEKIGELYPDLPLLVASGSRPDGLQSEGRAERAFLPKPYAPEALTSALDALLAGKTA